MSTTTTSTGAVPASRRFKDPRIEMSHGAGGKASRRLVEGLIAPRLLGANAGLAE